MIELDAAIVFLGCFRIKIKRFFLLIQELKNALGGSNELLDNVADLRQLRKRLREIFHVLDERLDVAHRNNALNSEYASQNSHYNVA